MSTKELVEQIVEKDLVEAKKSFSSVIAERVKNVLAERKVEVAKTFFNGIDEAKDTDDTDKEDDSCKKDSKDSKDKDFKANYGKSVTKSTQE